MLRLRLLLSLFFTLFAICLKAQQSGYEFWKDDTVLRRKYHDQSQNKKQQYLTAAGKQYAKDYKEIYDEQFRSMSYLWRSTRTVTAPEAHNYLQFLVQRIIAANPVLKGTDARIVFTRDAWPNAVSMGEGTIVVNAGLMVFLANEAELAFVLCHELAHYYLDHSNQTIRKMVEEVNSDAFKAEMKRLSKQEYGVRQQLETLLKKMAFGSRKHSRDHEAEADRQAFRFMKNTGFDCGGIETCLQMLDRVDDSSLYKPLVPEATFHFDDYPFKKKWTQKQSAIFAQMGADESPLTRQERDSLKTHPDCEVRIRLLSDSVKLCAGGQKFLVDEALFNKLKKEFLPEMIEQEFRNDNLAGHLYYNALMLQAGDHVPLAVYSISRVLNLIYERQKDHKLGDIDKENRAYPADYNLLLRMLDRLKLDEIATLNYYFCKKYESQMAGHEAFRLEMQKAQRRMIEHQSD
jgi:Zn-dependent protease with chaperone function